MSADVIFGASFVLAVGFSGWSAAIAGIRRALRRRGSGLMTRRRAAPIWAFSTTGRGSNSARLRLASLALGARRSGVTRRTPKTPITSVSAHNVQRYTFSMATSGWVSALLEAAGRVVSPIDPYLLVLYGHGSGGAERARDDNSGVGDRAQLSDLFLAAGSYTIEATTAASGDIGGYRLSIDADFAAQAPDQPVRVDARVGQPIARDWSYLPAGAAATVQSITPFGLTAAVTSDQGNATLTATASRAGDYTVTVAYTASGHTSTIATKVKILCPPRHVTTTTRTCTPLATALPAGCAVTSLNTNGYWGSNAATGRYSAYSTKAPAGCESLSESGSAAYFRFTVPDRPGRLPVRVAVDSAEPRGVPTQVFADGGNPSLTLWAESRSSLSFKAHASTHGPERLFVELDLVPGRYVAEIAPSQRVSRPNDRYRVRAIGPAPERTRADVQHVGNTGLGGAGMTLGQFLDARGSLIYGAHPEADKTRADDPFYPESVNYPWLPFTTDRCSIPPAWILHLAENAIDRAAIRLSPLAWLAAHYLLPDADEIQDHPQFGGETVQFVYGCMRHDFNWRNLHRIKHHLEYDTTAGTWNDTVRKDADTRLGTDLVALCKANQDDAPETSRHYKWELQNQRAIDRCEIAASTIRRALGAVPFSWIGSDYEYD